MSTSLPLASLWLCATVLLAAPAAATDYYVSASGNDLSAGRSPAAACAQRLPTPHADRLTLTAWTRVTAAAEAGLLGIVFLDPWGQSVGGNSMAVTNTALAQTTLATPVPPASHSAWLFFAKAGGSAPLIVDDCTLVPYAARR